MKKSLLLLLLFLSALTLNCVQEEGEAKIRVVVLSPRDMIDQMRLGQIDGFVAWEPFVSEAVVKGIGKAIAWSSDIWPNHPCCVVAVRSDLDEDVVRALIWAHIKATRFINDEKNYDKVLRYAVEFTGREEKVVREALKHIKFVEYPDKKEFRVYYERLKKSGYLTKTVKEIGYSNEDEFFSDFLYDDAYRSVLETMKRGEVPKVNVTLRIGYLTADLHQLAFYVALKEGYFREVGIKVVAKEYVNGVEEMNNFKIGEIDAGYLGGAPATLKRINEDIKIRIVAGVNNEGSAIVARDAKSLRELVGKKVAIPGFGTVQDFLLRKAAEKEGIKVEAG